LKSEKNKKKRAKRFLEADINATQGVAEVPVSQREDKSSPKKSPARVKEPASAEKVSRGRQNQPYIRCDPVKTRSKSRDLLRSEKS